MSSGKTDELIAFSKRYTRKTHKGHHIVLGQSLRPSDKEPRDRSLRGKARIRARRARYSEGW